MENLIEQLRLVASGAGADRRRDDRAGLLHALDRHCRGHHGRDHVLCCRRCRRSCRRSCSRRSRSRRARSTGDFVRPLAEHRDDQPLLNRRGARMVGRRVVIVEPIVNGRGKVQASAMARGLPKGRICRRAAKSKSSAAEGTIAEGARGRLSCARRPARFELAPPGPSRKRARARHSARGLHAAIMRAREMRTPDRP